MLLLHSLLYSEAAYTDLLSQMTDSRNTVQSVLSLHTNCSATFHVLFLLNMVLPLHSADSALRHSSQCQPVCKQHSLTACKRERCSDTAFARFVVFRAGTRRSPCSKEADYRNAVQSILSCAETA